MGNLQKINCGAFRKLPLTAFPHSATEKFRISTDHKTTVRSHCTTDVQPIAASGIPWSLPSVFFVVHFPQNRVVFTARRRRNARIASLQALY